MTFPSSCLRDELNFAAEVVEASHEALLRHGGHYAALWRRQSGGFLDAEIRAGERTAA